MLLKLGLKTEEFYLRNEELPDKIQGIDSAQSVFDYRIKQLDGS